MSEIGKPDNKVTIEVHDAINSDIMTILEKNFERAASQAAPIAYKFKGKDRIETARNIWLWLRKEIKYKKDPEGFQDIRLPRYFHAKKTGDCKSFTINALAIYHNIYPADKLFFFYAGYVPFTETPTHVYAKIMPASGGPEIIIDGCWYFFNSEKAYTFGKYSKNMTVRTLSDNLSEGHARPSHDLDLQGLYDSMGAYDRGRMDACMSDLVQIKLMELAKKQNAASPAEIMQGVEQISGKGGKGKKALHYINMAALFLGRAAFLLFVTLNVNGLASKLAQLHKWKKDGGILNTWYIMGGNVKKFNKIVDRAKNKKKFFLSKKAKRKYEERYGPLSPNEVAYNKGVHGEIGALPAVAAAAIAVIPVLAGIIPKMIEGFRAAGSQGHKEAAGLIGEGKAMAEAVQQNGYPMSSSVVESFMAPGDQFHGPASKSGARVGAKPVETKYVFDWHNLHLISGIADDAPAPANLPYTSPEAPKDKFSQTMETLGPILTTVASAGLQTASSVMQQSENGNIAKWGRALGGAESALVGNVLNKAGYADDARFHMQQARVVNLFPIALGGGGLLLALGLYSALKSKPAPVAS